MALPQRSGTRTVITLLLIAALAAIVWKLYVVDDGVSTNTNTVNGASTQNANATGDKINTNSSTNEANSESSTSNTNNTNTSATSSRTKIEQIEKNGFYLTNLPAPTVSGDGQEAFIYNGTDAISTVDPDTESIIRGSYGVTSEEEITIDGVNGKRLKGTSPKDGAVVEYILITNGDKLIFARGSSTFLDQLIDTLELD